VGLCRARGAEVRLSLIGDGRERKDFERQARDLGLDSGAVGFLGYVKNDAALQLLRTADVGLIPHHADESWNTTIPNKLFDYMAAGLPVIGSSAPPVQRVIEETGCGTVFKDRDAGDLADAILSLRDPAARAACSAAGRRAVTDKYNWEADAARLVEAVEATVGVSSAA
jgi:glycosyltransferase involved in cell wall biosynthesis